MTSHTDASRRPEDDGSSEGRDDRGPVARAAAAAAELTTQQAEKAAARVDAQLSSQRDQVTGRVRSLSRALRGAGEMLEQDELVSRGLHYASEKVEGLAGYVEELSPQRAADDLRGVARDRPAWFFGGAFVIGLALGRFARASAEVAGDPSPASRRAPGAPARPRARPPRAGDRQP